MIKVSFQSIVGQFKFPNSILEESIKDQLILIFIINFILFFLHYHFHFFDFRFKRRRKPFGQTQSIDHVIMFMNFKLPFIFLKF
ncbi:hypothetical protein BpHYR1_049892 [Brachionus plicatilis]|uniref:Uncharacterized protein n=1 Tax=Brachionus plicatilis TaxID=10195 RepID=A0A3M7QFJ6_BRAPC|nr:hypothetical protein BpHYR1_049892 [Brachionus plicatilis]